jgi:MFS family permease
MMNLMAAFLNLVVLVLAVLSLTYVQKLEQTGCACADHPYRKYIKAWLYVAIVVFLLMLVANLGFAAGMKVNKTMAAVLGAFYLLFGLATLAFYVLAILYVRYLMKEKCKCSEDNRRTVLYVWSIVEVILIAFAFLVGLLLAVSGAVLTFVSGLAKPEHLVRISEKVMESTVNPLASAKLLQRNLGRELRKVKKLRK